MKITEAKQILERLAEERNNKKNKKIYEFITILESILEDFKHDITALPHEDYIKLIFEKPVTNSLIKLFKKTQTKTICFVVPSYDYEDVEIIGLKYSVPDSYRFCALSREEDVAEFVMYVSDKINE